MQDGEKEKEDRQTKNYSECSIKYSGTSLNFWIFILISVITAMISILSTSALNDNKTETVFIVFIGILIIVFAVYVYGFWGVLSAALSSFLFCLSIKTNIIGMLLNEGANTAQALIIYFVFKFSKIDESVTEKGGIINNYKFLMLALGGAYVVLSFIFNRYLMLYVFTALLLIISSVYCIIERSPKKLLYVVFACVLPSLAGGFINSCFEFTISGFTALSWYNSFALWFLSNGVLYGTFGYLLLGILGKFYNQSQSWQNKKFSLKLPQAKTINLKISSIILYVSTLLWNVLFYVMNLMGYFQINTPLYLFPWAVGNAFFIINLYLTKSSEIDGCDSAKAFEWYENRSVVAERNTQMLIAVIAFLLPLCASYLGVISDSISFVFVLNITAAIVSIGLIWVPQNNAKIMEIIKSFKTVFHLYTLSLLLLNVIMIISAGMQAS